MTLFDLHVQYKNPIRPVTYGAMSKVQPHRSPSKVTIEIQDGAAMLCRKMQKDITWKKKGGAIAGPTAPHRNAVMGW